MNPDSISQTEDLAASQFRRSDGLWEGIARVSGMDCGACAVEIEHAAKQVSGLHEFTVNPASHLARWVAHGPNAIEQLMHKLARLGYAMGLHGEEASQVQALRQKRAARNRFLRFLVAALCMMQIMMYSAPEYVFSVQEIGLTETRLLRWAQWVLTLPLVVYCALPHLRRAWVAAWQRRLVMDQPIILGLLLAFVLSSLNLNNPANHVWFDSIAMLLTLLLLVQMLIENQTSKALAHLAGLQPDLPLKVQLQDGPGWRDCPVAQLQAGQRYRLFSGLAVPVDSLLADGQAPLWVDEAMRTGEAEPVCKAPGELVQAGSRIQSPMAVLVVKPSLGLDSLGSLGQLLLQALAVKPRQQDRVQGVLPWFVLAVLCCAMLTTLVWWGILGRPDLAATATLAVLIVTCPCALALALPLTHLFAVRQLADLGVLVRNPQALDTLNHVQCVALDKTGTLTTNHAVQVRQSECCGHSPMVEPTVLNALLALAHRSSHPLARAVSTHLLHRLEYRSLPIEWDHLEERPGAGLVGVLMIDACAYEIRLGSAAHCGVQQTMQALSAQVFASCTSMPTALNPAGFQALQFAVVMNIDQALPRQMNVLKSLGLSLHVLSGDHSASVESWAPQLLFNSRCGGMSPAEKTAWIAGFQQQGKAVAMVGDGLNDSGAFAQADVSFAAAGASTLSAGQADFMLMNAGIAGVVASFQVARQVERIGAQNLWWALVYNGLAVPVAMMGLLTPWMASLGMGISSLVVFANALRLRQEVR
ncbi:MAG TPA: HAD-IC family P-type ATPase [Limnobacter sp.]|nr:HAD-IC family P-type ATPase [Limnobacter sp.]